MNSSNAESEPPDGSVRAMPQWAEVLAGLSLCMMFVLCTFENHSRVGRAASTGVFLGIVAIGIWKRWLDARPIRPLLWPVAAVYTAILIACAASIEPAYSFKAFLYQHLWFGLVLLAVAVWGATERRQEFALWGLLAAGGISAALGLIIYRHGGALEKAGYIDKLTDYLYKAWDANGVVYYRAKGMLESYTRSAMVFIMTLPATVALLLLSARRKRWGMVALATVAALLSVAYLLLTKSRGAWLATALACLLTFILLRGRWWVPLVVAAVLGVVISAVPPVRSRAMSLVRDVASPNLFFSGRLELWRNGMRPIRENLLTGVGYGGNIFLTDKGMERYELISVNHRQPDLHQIYLQTLAECGVIGLVAYAWLMVMLLRFGYMSIRAAGGGPVSPGPAVALPVLVSMLILGVVYYMNERHMAHMLAGTLGLLVANKMGNRE